MEQQGFFVKTKDSNYLGPFLALSEARNTARSIGPDLEIYHGILKKNKDESYNQEHLHLIPKLSKDY